MSRVARIMLKITIATLCIFGVYSTDLWVKNDISAEDRFWALICFKVFQNILKLQEMQQTLLRAIQKDLLGSFLYTDHHRSKSMVQFQRICEHRMVFLNVIEQNYSPIRFQIFD